MSEKYFDIKRIQKVPVEEFENHVPHNPLVSVCVQTYQHVNYIKQCLDGILMQETDFDFEILLGEDESTDGTREICIDYAKKYPDKIRLFLHNRENVIHIDGNPTGRFNMLYNLDKANGKYIAFCEGDDYWINKEKLQIQVDFLEANSEFAICFHKAKIIYENNLEEEKYTNINQEEVTTIKGLAYGNFIDTASVVFKNINKEIPDWILNIEVADYPVLLLAAKKGLIKYIDKCMSIYRRHEGGVWSREDDKTNNHRWLNVVYFLIDKFDPDTNIELAAHYVRYYHESSSKHPVDINQIGYIIKHYELKLSQIKASKRFLIGSILLKPFDIIKNIIK